MAAITQQASASDRLDDPFILIQTVYKSFRPLLLERAGSSSHTSKQDGSPVTATDMEVELAVQAELSRRCPGVPIYGEETGYGSDLPATCWLIDPIDGTSSFLDGTPTFTNMAVLIEDGEATASIIYNPSSDDMYTAKKGHGAYKNDQLLDLTTVPLPQIAYCKKRFTASLNEILNSSGVICDNGPEGGGYGFTMVVDGLSAARFNLHSRGYTHDYAPGALLVREAGGSIIPIQDQTYTYESRSFIACHPKLADALNGQISVIRDLESQPS